MFGGNAYTKACGCDRIGGCVCSSPPKSREQLERENSDLRKKIEDYKANIQKHFDEGYIDGYSYGQICTDEAEKILKSAKVKAKSILKSARSKRDFLQWFDQLKRTGCLNTEKTAKAFHHIHKIYLELDDNDQWNVLEKIIDMYQKEN